jgi:conjugative transposon TraM protein
MEIREHRQRKFYSVLPLIALPFITLLFWALGGGKVQESTAQQVAMGGLMMQLPDAALKDDQRLTKFDFYNQARIDSLKFQELIRNDPNYNRGEGRYSGTSSLDAVSLNTSLNSELRGQVSNEERVYRKIAEVEKQLAVAPFQAELRQESIPAAANPEIERLEQMMKLMSNTDAEQQELQHLNGMLESILDIQHPQRVEQRYIKQKNVAEVFAAHPSLNISILQPEAELEDSEEPESPNEFFSWSDYQETGRGANAIRAVVHESQVVVNGSTVKFRLTQDISLNGTLIPKDNFIYGTAQLTGERLKVRIEHLRCEDNIYPLELIVFDLDGMEGIYIPGAISQQAVKQSADRNLNSIGIGSIDPSLGAQAASAAVEVTKNILSKKVKLINVSLQGGYQVLLQSANISS